jgi:hypothetical protein
MIKSCFRVRVKRYQGQKVDRPAIEADLKNIGARQLAVLPGNESTRPHVLS